VDGIASAVDFRPHLDLAAGGAVALGKKPMVSFFTWVSAPA
jgi:hypothetical protein